MYIQISLFINVIIMIIQFISNAVYSVNKERLRKKGLTQFFVLLFLILITTQ